MDEIAAQRIREALGTVRERIDGAQAALAYVIGAMGDLPSGKALKDFEVLLAEQGDFASTLLASAVNRDLRAEVERFRKRHPAVA